MMDLTKGQWVKHTIMHPFEGYEDLRWKKGGSMKISVFIIIMLFFSQVAVNKMYGFQFRASYDKIFNIIPYLIQSVVYFVAWVTGNWAVCTLLDGEGTMRNIWIFSAYALIPYIASVFINTVLSHILIRDEIIFMQIISVTGTLWSVILMFSAIKTVHQYSVSRTITAILLTFVAMLIILFLIILFLSLFQQVYLFVLSVYTEISYRIKV